MLVLKWIFQPTDVQRQLVQSQEDVGRLVRQLQKKNATLRELQQDSEAQTRETRQLQNDYDSMACWVEMLLTCIH